MIFNPRSLLIAIFCVLFNTAALADVSEIQRLNFGTWHFPGNDDVYDVSIALNGSYSHSPELVMIAPPEVGIYDIGELEISSVINSIDAVEGDPLASGGQSITMDDFVTSSSGSTDGNGRVTVTIGASAHTTGMGGSYPAGTYTGEIDLTFNY
jgi:hypothetical protein